MWQQSSAGATLTTGLVHIQIQRYITRISVHVQTSPTNNTCSYIIYAVGLNQQAPTSLNSPHSEYSLVKLSPTDPMTSLYLQSSLNCRSPSYQVQAS